MANSAQATKRARQNKNHAMQNRVHMSRMRTAIKKIIKTIKEGAADKAQSSFASVATVIDKTASKGVIHRNQASRLKSRLNKMLKKGKEA